MERIRARGPAKGLALIGLVTLLAAATPVPASAPSPTPSPDCFPSRRSARAPVLAPDERALTDAERDAVQRAVNFLATMGEDQAAQLQQMLDDGKILADDGLTNDAETPLSGETITIRPILLSNAAPGNTAGLIALAATLIHEKVHVHQDATWKFLVNFEFILCVNENWAELEAWWEAIAAKRRWYGTFVQSYARQVEDYNEKVEEFNELTAAECPDPAEVERLARAIASDLEFIIDTLEHAQLIAAEILTEMSTQNEADYGKGDYRWGEAAIGNWRERLDEVSGLKTKAKELLELMNRWIAWAEAGGCAGEHRRPQMKPEPAETLGDPSPDAPAGFDEELAALLARATEEQGRFVGAFPRDLVDSFGPFASLVGGLLREDTALPECFTADYAVGMDLPGTDVVGGAAVFGVSLRRHLATAAHIGGSPDASFDVMVNGSFVVDVLTDPDPAGALREGVEMGLVEIGETGTPPPDACPPIVGTAGDDLLVGTPWDDVIRGLGGDDVIKALGGPDRAAGGPGSDLLVLGGGGDAGRGGGGDDEILGGPGRDRAFGGPGNDHCRAELTASCEA